MRERMTEGERKRAIKLALSGQLGEPVKGRGGYRALPEKAGTPGT